MRTKIIACHISSDIRSETEPIISIVWLWQPSVRAPPYTIGFGFFSVLDLDEQDSKSQIVLCCNYMNKSEPLIAPSNGQSRIGLSRPVQIKDRGRSNFYSTIDLSSQSHGCVWNNYLVLGSDPPRTKQGPNLVTWVVSVF